jgi:glutathione S-transferase
LKETKALVSSTLTYFLAWESLAEREAKWNAFFVDPEWLAVRAATEKDGPIVASKACRGVSHPLQKGRAISGPHGHEQIPALVERNKERVANFYSDFEARLKEVEFVAGDRFSAADITTLVSIDFATRAFAMPIPDESVALTRWYSDVSARPSAAA